MHQKKPVCSFSLIWELSATSKSRGSSQVQIESHLALMKRVTKRRVSLYVYPILPYPRMIPSVAVHLFGPEVELIVCGAHPWPYPAGVAFGVPTWAAAGTI